MKFLLSLFISIICLSACQTIEQSGTDYLYLKQGMDAYQRNDYSRAANLWNKACNNNDAEACGMLGSMYIVVKGVQQDYSESAPGIGSAARRCYPSWSSRRQEWPSHRPLEKDGWCEGQAVEGIRPALHDRRVPGQR